MLYVLVIRNPVRNKIGLGARAVFALVAAKFVRTLAGELRAHETRSRGLSRANTLLVALENIIVESPQLHAGGPALRMEHLPQGIQLLPSEFKNNPSTVESKLCSHSPAHGSAALPALCCGVPGCENCQDPKNNHSGIVQLCSTSFESSTGFVVVEDTMDRRPFQICALSSHSSPPRPSLGSWYCRSC